ncbi:hypothetical protein EYF80_062038 [Liparis tanakae]|uniref:Uncharacterized protein n=1 Tax=Liparis tanakae TaxID=230148 RepID=A0A4Z2EH68_9TELE|nr:hypothetical protein EYF80_062038 [Liparis tanakae]
MLVPGLWSPSCSGVAHFAALHTRMPPGLQLPNPHMQPGLAMRMIPFAFTDVPSSLVPLPSGHFGRVGNRSPGV